MAGNNNARWWPWLVAVIVLCCSVGWSWDRNASIPPEDWHGDLRSDAAGYYIYLPGAFHHGMRASGWSPRIVDLTGEGAFTLDPEIDRVLTKYTYGVALLEGPFYFLAELITPAGERLDGFSPTHRRMVELGGCLYWVLGCVLLGAGLQRRWPARPWVPVTALLLVSLGSNIWFYAARMPGYSHIHSFFAVCLAIHAACRLVTGSTALRDRLLFHAACALILLIRPIDAIAVLGLYAWLLLERPALLASWRWWAWQALVALVLFIPQGLYWRFAYGSFLSYSYGDEGFTHWASPELLKFLFSPRNGWVPHAPVLLLLPFGLWSLWRDRPQLAAIVFATLLLLVYACASWWTWSFGCAYGARPAVQYMPFVALAVHVFLRRSDRSAVRWRHVFLPLTIALVAVHFCSSVNYDLCYGGTSDWDWQPYLRNLFGTMCDR